MYYVLGENIDPYFPEFGRYLNKLALTIGAEVKWTTINGDQDASSGSLFFIPLKLKFRTGD